jgi:tetratricopeptide (TPR) repeat protein
VKLRAESDRLMAAGDVRGALDFLRRATEADPTAKNYGDLGRLLMRLTAFDEAAINLRRAAALEPDSADRWIDLANVYYRKIELGEAWKAERKAREVEPGLILGRDADGMRVRKSDSAAPPE